MFPSSLAVLTLALAQTAPQQTLGPAKEMKVLYAGALGEKRADRFLAFLEPWFAEVEAIGLDQLDMKIAAPYDVVIADWKRQYENGDSRDDADAPMVLKPSFTKPVILLGAVAGTAQYHSKIDWL